MARKFVKIKYAIIAFVLITLFCCHKNKNSRTLTFVTDQYEAQFDLEYVESNLVELAQDDPQLIRYSRIKYLSPPSKLPYELSGIGGITTDHSDTFSRWVANVFRNKKNGIFIEAGAHTGAQSSHTLMLEIQYNWTGLLVECNPTLVPILRQRHRKAWIADVCLSPAKTPRLSNFSKEYKWTQTERVETSLHKNKSNTSKMYEMYSIPLYTLVAAHGWNEIDFLALDVGGIEMEILLTIPFDLLTIKILTVKDLYHKRRSMLGKMEKFLRKSGMHFMGMLEKDRVYIHKSMIPTVGDFSVVNLQRLGLHL